MIPKKGAEDDQSIKKYWGERVSKYQENQELELTGSQQFMQRVRTGRKAVWKEVMGVGGSEDLCNLHENGFSIRQKPKDTLVG